MMNDAVEVPVPVLKRRRGDDGVMLHDSIHGSSTATTDTAIQKYVATPSVSSSSLPCPILQLTGHTGSVYALKYSPSGSTLCSASFDMTCLLWQHRPIEYDDNDDDDDMDDFLHTNPTTTSTATYQNFHVLQGHKNAVLDCSWLDHRTVITASADQTLILWDVVSQQRLRKYSNHHDAAHTGIVNAVATINEQQFVSVSDDTTIRLWDRRSKYSTSTYTTDFPVLAVAASSGILSEYQIYTAGIDPVIRIWDVRRNSDNSTNSNQPLDQLHGHTDTVTCLSVHPDGTHLLSNSMDRSLMQWDVRPFVGQEHHLQQQHHHRSLLHPRHVRTYTGHQHSAEKGLLKCSWSADGTFVTAGSSDTRVHIWDVLSGQEIYDLPGHKGCVNAVTFHPTESTVVASGSSDKHIFVGELMS